MPVNTPEWKLAHAPIVEAVLDIDCDVPLPEGIGPLEGTARARFRDTYPKFRKQLLQGYQIRQSLDEPPQVSTQRGIQAFQFLQEDEKQLVQVRAQGFSFNRLAPYASLDDYLPEIERTWRLFVEITSPVQIRQIRLRYINRILLPLTEGRVELGEYLKAAPQLPDESALQLTGFLSQTAAVERETGSEVKIILTNQVEQGGQLPVILDIEASRQGTSEPEDWNWILSEVQSLRGLKNRVFRDTLTTKCLELFL